MLCFEIAFFTGIREGEVLGLTWECLDLDNGTLTIKQQLRREQHKDGQFYFSKPKNNKTRTLTLAPSVVKLFRLQKLEQNRKRLKAGKNWTEKNLVFFNEVGGFLSHRVIYRCFKELVKEIGTPYTRFHDLRHPNVKPKTKNFYSLLRINGQASGHIVAYFLPASHPAKLRNRLKFVVMIVIQKEEIFFNGTALS